MLQKKVLKGKPLPEDEASIGRIRNALLERDFSEKEVDEVIERLTLLNPEEL